jgi:rare lipoprotein A
MNKIILVTLLLTLFGCSTEQIKNASTSYSSPTEYSTVRQHATLSVNIQDEKNAEDTLLPRISRYIKQGIASWYGPGFHGKKTATGEIFDMYAMTAAHKTLPIPSYAQVTNLVNHRSIIVRINDRGPFVGNKEVDLSYAAAKNLDLGDGNSSAIEIKAISPKQALPKIQQLAATQEKQVFLQVGSFGTAKKALELKNKIAASNLPSADIRSSTYKKSTLYKVQIGPIKSTVNANELNQQLAEIGIIDTQFVTESNLSQSTRVIM